MSSQAPAPPRRPLLPPAPAPVDHPNDVAGALRPAGDVEAMFDRISHSYDTMNRLMTAGRDVAWRRVVARQAILGGRDGRVLDVATGTGDLALALVEAGARQVTAVDVAEQMLDVARHKAAQRTEQVGDGAIAFLHADAMHLPFADDTFDACAIAFGLRNLADYAAGIREMVRVIRPGGRWICLELTPLRVPLLRQGFGFYFDRVVPFIGGHVSGDRDAYRYLPASVRNFPTAPELIARMEVAGLVNTRYRLLAGGTVAIHTGEKSWPDA